jgi:cystathionine beta-synthase
VQGVLQMADKFKEGDVVVIILHDHGSRYVGKVYNDDWMRDRGFLVDEVITARSIIERKKDIKQLVSVLPTHKVSEAFKLMKEMGLTQLPVMNGNTSIGSMSENLILHLLMEDNQSREKDVSQVMGKPFPAVSYHATASEISKLISKDNTAVMVQLPTSDWTIITEFDLIEAMA